MKAWGPDSLRTQLDIRDLSFVAKHVNGAAFEPWMLDSDARDTLLDAAVLFHAITREGQILEVSQKLFFYVLVRHYLRKIGLDDRSLADFLGLALEQWTRLSQGAHKIVPRGHPAVYWVDHVAVMRSWDQSVALANYLLCQQSFAANFIDFRRERRGAPGASYYAHVSRGLYEDASRSCPLEYGCGFTNVLETLVDSYEGVLIALRRMIREFHF